MDFTARANEMELAPYLDSGAVASIFIAEEKAKMVAA